MRPWPKLRASPRGAAWLPNRKGRHWMSRRAGRTTKVMTSTMTRRQFLQRTGKAALGLTILSQAGLLSGCGGTSSSDTIWDELAQRLQGPLVRPDDDAYDSLYLPFNRRYEDVR